MNDSVAIVMGFLVIASIMFTGYQINCCLLHMAEAIRGLKNEKENKTNETVR